MGDLSFGQGSDPVVLFDDASGNQLIGQKTMVNSVPIVIASDQTIGALNTPYNKTILDAGKMFGFAIEQNMSSTGEQNLALFRNPSGSGKTAYIKYFNWGTVDSLTRYRVRMYIIPTVTGTGTSKTIVSYQAKTSPPSTGMQAYSLPTTSSRGSLIRTYARADTNSYFEDFNYSLSIAAGYDILFTGDTDATNKILFADLQWSEE